MWELKRSHTSAQASKDESFVDLDRQVGLESEGKPYPKKQKSQLGPTPTGPPTVARQFSRTVESKAGAPAVPIGDALPDERACVGQGFVCNLLKLRKDNAKTSCMLTGCSKNSSLFPRAGDNINGDRSCLTLPSAFSTSVRAREYLKRGPLPCEPGPPPKTPRGKRIAQATTRKRKAATDAQAIDAVNRCRRAFSNPIPLPGMFSTAPSHQQGSCTADPH